MYVVTKTYPHNLGLSAVFRQPGAQSHCRHLHGYALEFEITFESFKTDSNNWVIDFGALKPIKEYLVTTFDHALLIAMDDPKREHLEALEALDLANIKLVPAVGCEAFASMVGRFVLQWLHMSGYEGRGVRLRSVRCAEHAGNSATWEPNPAPTQAPVYEAR